MDSVVLSWHGRLDGEQVGDAGIILGGPDYVSSQKDGLAVSPLTEAKGMAERDAALDMLLEIPSSRRLSVGTEAAKVID